MKIVRYSEPNLESRNYFMTSLFQLEKILFEKKIYARQNVPALKQLAHEFPGIDINLRDVASQENYSMIFHDSIHYLIKLFL